MRKAFVILTQGATSANQTAIQKAFAGWGWWHYFSEAWILVDGTGSATVDSVRNKIMEACPGLRHFVFEMQTGADFSGYAPTDWVDWLNGEWQKK